MIEEMDYKEYIEYLSSSNHYTDVYVYEVTLEQKVKMTIDGYDPYCIIPGEYGPYVEYDEESSRIAAEIMLDVSKEEVSDVIAIEFSRAFNKIYS